MTHTVKPGSMFFQYCVTWTTEFYGFAEYVFDIPHSRASRIRRTTKTAHLVKPPLLNQLWRTTRRKYSASGPSKSKTGFGNTNFWPAAKSAGAIPAALKKAMVVGQWRRSSSTSPGKARRRSKVCTDRSTGTIRLAGTRHRILPAITPCRKSWRRRQRPVMSIPRSRGFRSSATSTPSYSPFLQLRYNDGATLELDIDKDFSATALSNDATRDAIAHATLGRSGRIFPTVLNQRTVPRLWTAREQAFADQNADANLFMGIAIAATAFVLSVPAMPVGMAGAAGAAPKGMKRSVPGVRVPPSAIQNNVVRLGAGNTAGSLWASIQKIGTKIVYRVDMIVLQGEGAEVAAARATHREMIRRAALQAQANGETTFLMVGKQANPNFVRHADQLAREIGVIGSGKQGMSGAGFPDYTVVLDVGKTLAQ